MGPTGVDLDLGHVLLASAFKGSSTRRADRELQLGATLQVKRNIVRTRVQLEQANRGEGTIVHLKAVDTHRNGCDSGLGGHQALVIPSSQASTVGESRDTSVVFAGKNKASATKSK